MTKGISKTARKMAVRLSWTGSAWWEWYAIK